MNNIDGWGILVVDGDLTLSGNVNWKGVIFVSGDLVLNGNANDQIWGSVMVGGSVTTNGNPEIYYNCEDMDEWIAQFSTWQRKWWRQL